MSSWVNRFEAFASFPEKSKNRDLMKGEGGSEGEMIFRLSRLLQVENHQAYWHLLCSLLQMVTNNIKVWTEQMFFSHCITRK